MPIQYSDEFKKKAVYLLKEVVNKEGTIVINGEQINNVRELVKFLGISTYTLYQWKKELVK